MEAGGNQESQQPSARGGANHFVVSLSIVSASGDTGSRRRVSAPEPTSHPCRHTALRPEPHVARPTSLAAQEAARPPELPT